MSLTGTQKLSIRLLFHNQYPEDLMIKLAFWFLDKGRKNLHFNHSFSECYRKESWGNPSRGNRLQVSDFCCCRCSSLNKTKKNVSFKIPCYCDNTWLHLNLTFLKTWDNQCVFLMAMFFLSYVNELCIYLQFSSVQLLSHLLLFETLWIIAHLASLSNTNSLSSLKHTCIESVMPSRHFILCRPLLLL